MSSASHSERVAILLSTFEGARYLPQQLESLCAQTHTDWVLLWRDDGSHDETVAIMERFAAGEGAGRCLRISEPVARLGPCESFLILLRWAAANLPDIAAAAFADQDDVWLPEKLARALDALGREIDSACPALYCARQTLVDDALRPIGRSLPFRRVLGFPDSLTQNIATGATIMLNRAALSLIATVPPPRNGHHDWWSYLLVTAAGGKVVADDTPVLLYRQHDSNAVGAPASLPRRAQRAIRRGPDEFMGLFARHVAALSAADTALTPAARASLSELRRGLAGGMLARLRTLGKLDLRRRTWLETLVFRLWFVLGARVEGLPSDR